VEHFLVGLGLPAALVTALKLATLGRLMLAAVLGGLVGLERELKAKPAGLRTTLLICVGAAMFTELSLDMAMLATAGGDAMRADPARLAAQIIPGIGFIGAGAILHGRGRVTGLTTAATLWVVTAIGIGVGSGAYVESIVATLMVLGTLHLLGRMERAIRRHTANRRYTAAVDAGDDTFERLIESLQGGRLQLRVDTMEKVGDDLEVTFRLAGPQHEHDRMVKAMIRDKGVRSFKRG
jgi:putative Mg2+ transporter-C (MgtC) family protein